MPPETCRLETALELVFSMQLVIAVPLALERSEVMFAEPANEPVAVPTWVKPGGVVLAVVPPAGMLMVVGEIPPFHLIENVVVSMVPAVVYFAQELVALDGSFSLTETLDDVTEAPPEVSHVPKPVIVIVTFFSLEVPVGSNGGSNASVAEVPVHVTLPDAALWGVALA